MKDIVTSTIDENLFSEACDKYIDRQQGLHGIGTLQEKTIHAVLKYYYAPDESYHEIKIGSYFADICKEGEIFEIQTGSFQALRKKLEVFLDSYDVTIIYPIPNLRKIFWIQPETGEIIPSNRYAAKGKIYDILPELYKIKSFLNHEHLHFILTFLDMEEYRIQDGWSKDRKKGATKTDRIPKKIVREFRIDTKEDYLKFLPDSLPDHFTVKDVIKASVPKKYAGTLLHILHYLDLIKQVGKEGRAYLYQRK